MAYTTGSAININSLFHNLSCLLDDASSPFRDLALGMRWSLGLPQHDRAEPEEFSLPYHWRPFDQVVAERSGVHIITHRGEEEPGLYTHLAKGTGAVVAVDSFFLPYRPAFGRVHSSRTVLIRPGTEGELLIEDYWLPIRFGTISRQDLEQARWSKVPRDDRREPVFAGLPCYGRWWSIETNKVSDSDEHLRSLLTDLAEEVFISRDDVAGIYGRAAWERLRNLPGCDDNTESIETRRRTALILRAEVSNRVFLARFFSEVAERLGEPLLRTEADIWEQSLTSMVATRDLLIKSLRQWRPDYKAIWAHHLEKGESSEFRMAETVAAVALT